MRLRPADRRATRAGGAAVAGGGDVAEVQAAGPLHEVAADGGHVAQLRRRAQLQRLRDHRELLAHTGMGGELGHPHQRSDAQPRRREVDVAVGQAR